MEESIPKSKLVNIQFYAFPGITVLIIVIYFLYKCRVSETLYER